MSPRKRNVRTSTSRKRKVTEDTPATVVGVGASAGGLEAFRSLLHAVPDNRGLAFVLIQHLDPAQESHLKELLSRDTKMPVEQVADGMRVRANHVYVTPPKTHMVIRNGTLRLVAYGDSQTRHNPIDHFFESLAEERGGNSIGVVLSGTASDGTRGLKAIKAAGGITFAQDEKTAGYGGMPHSAIAAGCVDFVLDPEHIAAELVRLSQQPYVRRQDAAPEMPSPGSERRDVDLDEIYHLVRQAKGIDLRDYKPATVARRLSRRMTIHKIENLEKYLRYLRKNPSELDELCEDIFIHVTGFFRDRDSFEALRTKVFPNLIRSGKGGQIRVWCPGCSSGEELYSIAILLLEYLGVGTHKNHVQLFGTDISASAIDRARAGLYPESIDADVSRERLKRFFVKRETGYQISKAVRELCVFAEHDLAKQPPFSKIDLISCRNVLIYLSAPLQKRIGSLFHYALNPNGFLLLGPSESIQASSDLFTLVDRKHKIYARKPSTGRHVTDTVFPGPRPATATSRAEGATFDLRKEVERIILEQYAPAGLVVDGDLQILQFHGDISPFLAPSAGDVAFHLMKMLRPDLTLEVRSAIHQAQKKKDRVRREGITLEEHGRSWNVTFTVTPMHGRAAVADFLVLFEKTLVETEPSAASPSRSRVKAADHGQVAALKRELAKTQNRLRSIVDDQQTTYEELKAANEEILSSNEELHSTNEELETAKEELQAANEELTTLNEELNNRNAYLDALNNDLNNVLAGIEIPVLLLEKDHRVRRFTPAAGKTLNLIPGDLGRPISDIRFTVDVPDLDQWITEAIEELRVIRREVRDRDGKWYLLSIRPYRTAEDKITGALLALLDIDEFKKAVVLAEDARNYADAIIDTIREPLVVLDPELRIVSANPAFHRAFDYSSADTRGQMFFDLSGGAWNVPRLRELLLDVLAKGNELSDFELGQVFPKIGERRLLLNARQINRQGVGSSFILLAIEDITERRNAEQAVIERERTIRALLNSTSQAILAADAEGKICFHNLGAERLFGYSSSELMALRVEELIPERHRTAHVAHRAKYLAAPEVRAMGSGMVLTGRRKDGTEFPIDVGLSSVDNAHGPLAVAFIEDVTSLQKATTELRAHEAELRALTARLISVQESNNRVLGRELHDDFTQKLAALSMDVTTLANQQPTPADVLRKSLSHVAEQLGKAAADIHQFSRQLHPSVLEDLGLPAALKAECAAFSEQQTTRCEFIAESVPDLISEDVALCLYRIAQEALRNVGKHAEAERVEVRLTGRDDEIELAVIDFGNGFDLDNVKTAKGLGLVSMEERARMVNGQFSITSQEGQGTSVVVRVPLSKS